MPARLLADWDKVTLRYNAKWRELHPADDSAPPDAATKPIVGGIAKVVMGERRRPLSRLY